MELIEIDSQTSIKLLWSGVCIILLGIFLCCIVLYRLVVIYNKLIFKNTGYIIPVFLIIVGIILIVLSAQLPHTKN